MSFPVGTVVVIGHPANGCTATFQPDGTWRCNVAPFRLISDDDLSHAGRVIYNPDGDS